MKISSSDLTSLADEVFARGGCIRFKVYGGSMYPFIRDGDTVEALPVGFGDIRYADILIFKSPSSGKVTVHRVTQINRIGGITDSVITQGDSSSGIDGRIGKDLLVGKVVNISSRGNVMPLDNSIMHIASVIYTALLPVSKWPYLLVSFLCRQRCEADDLSLVDIVSDTDRGSANYVDSYKNIMMLDEAKRLITRFNEENISTIILKGAHLASGIYEDISARPMTDIDMLIKKEDLARADATLTSSGYIRPLQYTGLSENDEPCPVNSIMYFAVDRSKPAIHVHWHLINCTWPVEASNLFDIENVWRSSRPYMLDAVSTRVLSPEYQVLYLAYHSLHHSFDKTTMVSDIVEILRRYGDRMDWDIVVRECYGPDLQFIAFSALTYVCNVSGYKIDGIDKLKPKHLNLLQRMVMKEISSSRCSYRTSYIAFLSIQRTLKGKMKFIARTVFPSRMVMAHNLRINPADVRPYHYITRFFCGL